MLSSDRPISDFDADLLERRPLVERGNTAILARPPEPVLELLSR